MGIASRAFMYSEPSSASTALDMTTLIILEMLSTAPLLGESSTLDEQKKWPPVWPPHCGFTEVRSIAMDSQHHVTFFVS
jgi:hypothetical protein